jgi:hypothetical protein
MPLDEDIAGGQGEREPRLHLRPHAVHDPLAMADQRAHREHGLHQQAVLPRAALTPFQMAGIPLRGMERGIAYKAQTFFGSEDDRNRAPGEGSEVMRFNERFRLAYPAIFCVSYTETSGNDACISRDLHHRLARAHEGKGGL